MSYDIIWCHMISYDVIWCHMMSYDIIRYDKIWYVMIRHDMLSWHMVQTFSNFTFFFKIVWPCWGYVWVSSLVILRPSKNWKFLIFLLFSKVVYWPLGYYLASSLTIFSPEINIFEKSNKYFKKNVFLHICFLFSCIFKDK